MLPAFSILSAWNANINANVHNFQHVSLTWGMTMRERVDITAGPGTGHPSKPTQTLWCSLGPQTTPSSRGRSSKPWQRVWTLTSASSQTKAISWTVRFHNCWRLSRKKYKNKIAIYVLSNASTFSSLIKNINFSRILSTLFLNLCMTMYMF